MGSGKLGNPKVVVWDKGAGWGGGRGSGRGGWGMCRWGGVCRVGWGGVVWCWGWLGWDGDMRIPSDGILNTDKTTRCVIKSLRGWGLWLGEKRNYSINQFANQSVEFIC